MIDSELWWDRKEDRGEHGEIVLSPADPDPDDLIDDDAVSDPAKLHYLKRRPKRQMQARADSTTAEGDNGQRSSTWDACAAEELTNLRNTAKTHADIGDKEDFVERIWQRAHRSALDWKRLLNRFIQDDVCDYSFTPPDKRFQDSVFFLPDYNVRTEEPKHVLFLADTSGSVDDDALAAVYAEICRALTQFEGGLVGTLVFFDMRVYTPVPFADVNDLLHIKPRGGGGTDYHRALDYIRTYTDTHPPSSIVIFTDGHGDFPSETAADHVPVLWLFSDPEVTAPWGHYAYVDPVSHAD